MQSIKKELTNKINPFVNKSFLNPLEMFKFITNATKLNKESGLNPIRNFIGVVEIMDRESITLETELFTKEILEFYTKHNMGLLDKERDFENYKQFYSNLRGGEMGDYSDKFQEKLENVVDALKKFPNTKRAVMTMPYSKKLSSEVKHTEDAEYKCLRELHFFIDEGMLHCTGFMRAQAAIIFPKNIHFIGTVFNEISEQINIPVGTYTHFVTTLVYDRE